MRKLILLMLAIAPLALMPLSPVRAAEGGGTNPATANPAKPKPPPAKPQKPLKMGPNVFTLDKVTYNWNCGKRGVSVFASFYLELPGPNMEEVKAFLPILRGRMVQAGAEMGCLGDPQTASGMDEIRDTLKVIMARSGMKTLPDAIYIKQLVYSPQFAP